MHVIKHKSHFTKALQKKKSHSFPECLQPWHLKQTGNVTVDCTLSTKVKGTDFPTEWLPWRIYCSRVGTMQASQALLSDRFRHLVWTVKGHKSTVGVTGNDSTTSHSQSEAWSPETNTHPKNHLAQAPPRHWIMHGVISNSVKWGLAAHGCSHRSQPGSADCTDRAARGTRLSTEGSRLYKATAFVLVRLRVDLENTEVTAQIRTQNYLKHFKYVV